MPHRIRSLATPLVPRAPGVFGSIPMAVPDGEATGRAKGNGAEVAKLPVQPKLLNLSVYINEHLREELTLEVLAARMSLSPFHFHRKFRAYFGESLHQHIKRLRLERSAYALLYQLTPVSAVARASGYKTLSAFSHAFSAHFGVAPTRFREVMLMGKLAGLEGGLRERLGSDWIDRLGPVSLGTEPERPIGFLRADVKANGDLAASCAVLERLHGQAPGDRETVIATVDLFGLLAEGAFRLEIGFDTAELEPALISQLGSARLAGGRFATFEFSGPAKRLADAVRAIHHFWMPRAKERSRQAVHYVTSTDVRDAGDAHWLIHVPLEDPVLAAVPAQS